MSKKVLFFIPNLSVGGAEKVLVNLVNNMDRSKFDITVQTLFAGGVNEQFLSSNIKYKYCYKKTFRGNSHYFKLFSPERLYNKYIKEHYDIIVSYLEGPTARIVSGCADNGTKLVCWLHCRMENEHDVAVGFRNFDEAVKCYNRFDNIVCVSEWVKNYFRKSADYKKHIDVLYNTIETEMIQEKSLEPINDVKFSKDCFNLCSVGKIAEVKGFDRLAAVHKRLLDENIKNKVYILGVGSEQAEIEKYLSENNLSDSFIFLGYNTNPYKYVRACDLYVCSSRSEGFSTAVTEALIVGTPVVTTLCSGMTEMLGENNEYGIVTENNEDALFKGVKEMLTAEGKLEYYAKRAEERGKYFSTDKTARAVEDMLNSL